jgi:hypothetical protein
MNKLLVSFLIIYLQMCIIAQDIKVLESTESYIKFSINFTSEYQVKDTTVNDIKFQFIKTKQVILRKEGEPALPSFSVILGIPHNARIEYQIVEDKPENIPNKFIIPFTESDSEKSNGNLVSFDKKIYGANDFFPVKLVEANLPFLFRYIKINGLVINPFQFNPVTKELLIHKYIVIKAAYVADNKIVQNYQQVSDHLTEEYIKKNTINSSIAKNWIVKENKNILLKSSDTYSWYDPGKKYLKFYLKDKGVYRVTYEQLRNAGLPSDQININNLELFNMGEKIPIEVFDGGDGIFNEGDYIQFIGTPPPASPYCKVNIYNNSNVYWFSYQANDGGYFYKSKDGYPENGNWDTTIQSTYHTIHYEVDSIYERLGLAPDGKRDHWFWGKASGQNNISTEMFTYKFPLPENILENSDYTIRVKMHGMTNNSAINPDHRVHLYLTSQSVGEISWDGQNEAEFESSLNVSKIGLYESNNLQVEVKADITPDAENKTADEIRVNWFEIEYVREHRVNSNHYTFESSPGLTGNIRFSVWKWTSDNMSIYIPQKGIVIKNPWITNNEYEEILFTDSVKEVTEYFCTSNDFFLTPDSITNSISSNLRSVMNSADYIIITHPKFQSAALKLASFRSEHLKGFSNPRVKVVGIQEIYDEFSYGLLDPYSLQSFVKYAFENWVKPAPSYICLLGDMSWDYRGRIAGSRKNYIPSIPYHQTEYGEAVSDNMIVAVSGDDAIPDLAIGRLSCETLDEANILVDKIINYPADNSKDWKQKILLIAAGESPGDENAFHFDESSIDLENTFLTPNGYPAKKIFRYSNKQEYNQYIGDRPDIRTAINQGCVITNFFGHGGGYQWDFVFLNDDIYLLQNNNMLPMIFSITCYTAHFDNQDVFGEQFNKASGKGCIGFWGSSGLTVFNFGVELNNKLYDQIFNERQYVIGDALLYAKSDYSGLSTQQKDHIAVLTLLGDPALELALPDLPDFQVTSSSISLNPSYPVINDTTIVKVNVKNAGRIFPRDSVSVTLTISFSDTTYLLGSKKLGSFGEEDSVMFNWIPNRSGLCTFKAEVNLVNPINEVDQSDNTAANSFMIYNVTEPSIIKPFNGFNTTDRVIKFLFGDIGYYLSKSLVYYVEVDTSLDFINPVSISPPVIPANGLAVWESPQFPNGNYFWRARMLDGQQYSRWTAIQTFSISSEQKEGYYISGNQLKLFTTDNLIYSENNKALQINTSLLPPKPSVKTFIKDIPVTLPDSINGISAITTDGTYIYFGSMAYYNGPSKIYKMGTGYNGTEEGKMYGPVSNEHFSIWHQIFYYSDGNIYIPEGNAHSLTRLNPNTGEISAVNIPDGLLNASDSKVRNGGFYLASDGKYVYNLAYIDSTGNHIYTLRIFDPSNNWIKIKDMELSGESYYLGFCSFFVADGYIYPYENYNSGWIRRINLNTAVFEDEWLSYSPFQGYYAWCYDWLNDKVYASVNREGKNPKISKFAGTYRQANGSVLSQEIGPALSWKNVNYSMESGGLLNSYKSILQGYNSNTKNWDTLYSNLASEKNLDSLDAVKYTKLRVRFNMVDTLFGSTDLIKLKSLNIRYTNLPEIILTNEDITCFPDTVMQGFPLNVKVKVRNYGYSDAENMKFNFYLDKNTSPFSTQSISVPVDSVREIIQSVSTDNIVLKNNISVQGNFTKNDLLSFNNSASKNFYVSRDSVKPVFSIKFDGVEILNGDLVSARPKVVMTLKDNSPLPLSDTSRFFIFHNNNQVFFKDDSLKFTYTEYPNSHATIEWDPVLKDGKHTLEVLAKDASGNFFDTTAYSVNFMVNSKNDIIDAYNYPNPFKDETYFTFNITGQDLPDELTIKIFTVAGRLINSLRIPISEIHFGFNKVFWDGRDEDQNVVANGVYFYKIIYRNKNNSVTVTQKLAKVK